MTPERAIAAEAARSSAPPGRPPSRGKPEASGDPFGIVLDQHQARTADAEGQTPTVEKGSGGQDKVSGKRSQESGSQVAGRRSQDQDSDAAASAAAVAAAVPAPVQPAAPVVSVPVAGGSVSAAAGAAAVAGVKPAPVQVAAQAVATALSSQVGLPAAPQGAQAGQGVQAAPVAGGQPLPEAPKGAAQPAVSAATAPVAAPVAKPVAPAADAQVPAQAPAAKTPAGADAPKVPAQAAADASPAQPKAPAQQPTAPDGAVPAVQSAKPQTPAPAPDQQAKPEGQPAQPAPAPAQPAHPAAQPDQPAAPAPQQAPQPAATPLAAAPQATVAQAAPAAEPQAAAGMRLYQAVETVYAVIRMSQSSGITQARVQLHPEELGQVDIHLRQTPDGIVAKVVADASQAANVLRHAGDELRRALQAQGLNLTHFDVGTASQDERRSAFAGGDGQPQRRGGRSASDAIGSIAVTETSTEETTIRLPNGVLVDVLA